MPPTFAAHLAVPILRDFRRAAAEVEIDLVSPYGVGPPPSDVDVAVVYSKPTVTDLVRDLLWPVRLSLMCHPDIAARCQGKSLAEFIESNELVHVRLSDSAAASPVVAIRSTGGLAFVERRTRSGVRYGAARGSICAERRGHRDSSTATCSATTFAPARLVRPFEDTLDDGYGYYLITHPEALSDTAVALFRSWLIERFGNGAETTDSHNGIHLAVSNRVSFSESRH